MSGKLMQRWLPDAIRFMREASEFGDFHERLAQALMAYLPADGHICDAGCGLGDLALALSAHCREVSAVDVSDAALAVLREKAADVENLHIRCGDILTMQARYDAMVFCYFGRISEILQIAARQCSGAVVIVRRDCTAHRFSLGEVKRVRQSEETPQQVLSRLGIPFAVQHLALEFGQPFRNAEDAMSFFHLYNKSEVPVEEARVMEQLHTIEHAEYGLYLPSVRRMELICFSARNIPTEVLK